MVRNILPRFQEYFSWIRMLSIVQLLPDEAYSRRPTAHFHSIDSERLRVALFLLSRLHFFWCTFPKEPDSRRTTLGVTLLVDCGHALTDNCSHNGSEANSAPLNQPIVTHSLTVLLPWMTHLHLDVYSFIQSMTDIRLYHGHLNRTCLETVYSRPIQKSKRTCPGAVMRRQRGVSCLYSYQASLLCDLAYCCQPQSEARNE